MGDEQYGLSGVGLSGYMRSGYTAYGLLCQVGRYYAPALSGVGLSGAMLSGMTDVATSLRMIDGLSISLSGERETPECSFEMVSSLANAPATGAPVVIAVGSLQSPIFRGAVTKISRVQLAPGRLQFSCTAEGIIRDLSRRAVSGAWSNHLAGDILRGLLATYAPQFDLVGYVEDGVQLAEFAAQDELLIDVCGRLAGLCNFTFYVAPDRKVHFHAPETLDAPWDIADGEHFGNLKIDEDSSTLRTRIIVQYSTLRSLTQSFTGDGATKDFTLRQVPASLQTLSLNGVEIAPEEYGTHYEEDNSGKQFSIDYTRGIINTRDHATLTGGDTLTCVYTAKVPARLVRSDAAAVAARMAIDGNDGLYDYLIADRDGILSKADARAAADAELTQYAWPAVSASYTRVEDLFGILARMLQPGQRQALDQWGVDEPLQIQKVSIGVLRPASDATLAWQIDVSLGRPAPRLDTVLSASEPTDAQKDYDEIIEEETR